MSENTTMNTKNTKKSATKKKATATKKAATKKKSTATRLPEPVQPPLELGMGDIPAVPALRHALKAWGTGNGHQADLGIAQIARELSEKWCHFCGAPSSPTMALTTPWALIVLCPCLTVAAETAVMKPAPVAVVATQPANAMTAFQKKYGGVTLVDNYRENFPDWKNRIGEIVDLCKSRVLRHSEVIYSNRCQCGCEFDVTAGMIVRSLDRHGSHIEMRRCRTCRESLLAKLSSNRPGELSEEETIAVPTPAAPSNKKKKGRIPRLPLPEETAPLVATTAKDGEDVSKLGDALSEAMARLQQENA